MSVYGIGSVTTAQTQTTTDKGSLNVDDFLKLMTAQLQNLDPMGENSTDSSKYITQMSQFTMLEQLGNVSESLNNLSVLSQQQISFSMVGKTAMKSRDWLKKSDTVTGTHIRLSTGRNIR
jgi:flagellar basal-body rod modification protein FlgD